MPDKRFGKQRVTWEMMLERSCINEVTGCIEWIRGAGKAGYGEIRDRGRRMYTHRLSWELHFGEISEGMEVCHTCDNPPCIAPEHLFIGTHQQNMADSKSKGRHAAGEKNGHARLSESQVRTIRYMISGGLFSQRQIAKAFGVHSPQISRIKNRTTWSHI